MKMMVFTLIIVIFKNKNNPNYKFFFWKTKKILQKLTR